MSCMEIHQKTSSYRNIRLKPIYSSFNLFSQELFESGNSITSKISQYSENNSLLCTSAFKSGVARVRRTRQPIEGIPVYREGASVHQIDSGQHDDLFRHACFTHKPDTESQRLMTFAGTPTATAFSSRLQVTTEFASITHPSLAATIPGMICTPSPIHTLFPMRTGLVCNDLSSGGTAGSDGAPP